MIHVKIDGAAELAEFTAYLGDHHVADGELNLGVGVVDLESHDLCSFHCSVLVD